MVKERGKVDREAGISMRNWGWSAYKKRDAIHCPRCGYLVIPAGEPGTFDFPNVGVPFLELNRVVYIDVEVKAGNTSFAFKNFEKDQRDWAEKYEDRPKYIWLCIGRSLREKKKPRKTYLIPLKVFYEIEKNIGRLSVPYNYKLLYPYELTWVGDGVWELYDGFMEGLASHI